MLLVTKKKFKIALKKFLHTHFTQLKSTLVSRELWKDVGKEFRVETYLRNYKFYLRHHNICYLY